LPVRTVDLNPIFKPLISGSFVIACVKCDDLSFTFGFGVARQDVVTKVDVADI